MTGWLVFVLAQLDLKTGLLFVHFQTTLSAFPRGVFHPDTATSKCDPAFIDVLLHPRVMVWHTVQDICDRTDTAMRALSRLSGKPILYFHKI